MNEGTTGKNERLEEATDAASKTKGNDLQKILWAEEAHQLYNKIRQQKGYSIHGKLHHLEIPLNLMENPKETENIKDRWKILELPTEINQVLMDRNIHHFGQAETDQTPIFVP